MSTLATVLLCIGAAVFPLICFWIGYEHGHRVATRKLEKYWQRMEQVAIYWCQRAMHLRVKLDALKQKHREEGESWKHEDQGD